MALPAKCRHFCNSQLTLCSSTQQNRRQMTAQPPRVERSVAAADLASNVTSAAHVGDVLQSVTCQRLGDGVGVCFAPSLGTLVLLIKNAMPGEELVAKITAVKKGFCEGVKLSTLRPHDDAATPACKHFGTCGGCTLQSLQYPAQLAHKADAVAQQLVRVGKLQPDLVTAARQPPLPASTTGQYGYRNKVQLAFSSRVWLPEEHRVLDGAWGLGFYMPGSSSVVLPITECWLMSPAMNKLAMAVKDAAQALGLQPFNTGSGQGCLRYLIIRAATAPAGEYASTEPAAESPSAAAMVTAPLAAVAAAGPAVPSSAFAVPVAGVGCSSSAVEAAGHTLASSAAAAAEGGGGGLGSGPAVQCLMVVIVTTASCQPQTLQPLAVALMRDCAALGLVSVVHSMEAAAATAAAVSAAAATATAVAAAAPVSNSAIEHLASSNSSSSKLWEEGGTLTGSDKHGQPGVVAGNGIKALQDQAVQHQQYSGKRGKGSRPAGKQTRIGSGGSSRASKRGAQALSVTAMSVLAGVGHLQEQLCGLQFTISPHSFFQTNAQQAELLYQQVAAAVQGFYTARSSKATANLGSNTTAAVSSNSSSSDRSAGNGPATADACDPLGSDCSSSNDSLQVGDRTANGALSGIVLDLYCGTGTIALTVAGCCRQVIGVDVSASSIADAVKNAQRNGVTNVEFVCGDLAELAQNQNSAAAAVGGRGCSTQLSVLPDVIIVDPARAGLSRNVVDYILSSTAQRLVYVSCNAATQARDLQLLCAAGTTASAGMHSRTSTGSSGGQAKNVRKALPRSVVKSPAGGSTSSQDLQGLMTPFRLVSWTAVDMFPQTSHVETVVVLDR